MLESHDNLLPAKYQVDPGRAIKGPDNPTCYLLLISTKQM